MQTSIGYESYRYKHLFKSLVLINRYVEIEVCTQAVHGVPVGCRSVLRSLTWSSIETSLVASIVTPIP